ncbi:sodium/proline symporter PutP [Bacillus sp. FSL W7-1360]
MMISFILYLLLMLWIGWYGYKKTVNHADYALGGRALSPATAALSAGASDMSGWLMLGLPGSMYWMGLSAGWMAVGLMIGAYLNWLYLAPRLRTFTEVANNSITIPSFLENRFADRAKMLRMMSGVIIILFFTMYVSATMVAGGTVFTTILDVNYHTGLWIVAGVTIFYTFFGGFLAVSWTDVVQGAIMLLALVLVPIVLILNLNGPTETITAMQTLDPKLLDIWRGTSVVGVISLLAWGLGYFGQPHIIVRFMAMRTAKDAKPGRRIGMTWMIISMIGAMISGLLGHVYLSSRGISFDSKEEAERVFVLLGDILFHPLITGFIFCAIIAAVMSTISSQLLVTSSSLTEDLYKVLRQRTPSEKELVYIGRAAVVAVAVVALLFAWEQNKTILDLVGHAWAGFGAAFGPLMLLSLYWKRMTKWGALAGMVVGAVTVIAWVFAGLDKQLYEIVPGFIASSVAIYIVSLCTKKDETVTEGFHTFLRVFKEEK